MLGVKASDDFRRTLADHSDAVVLLLGFGFDEREALARPEAPAKGARPTTAPIFACAPVAASLSELRRLAAEHPAWLARLRRAPTLSASPGGSAAVASLEAFGRVRSVDLAERAAPADAPLSALLIDAMEFIARTLGEPESIDASLSGIDAESGLRLAPGESLLALSGDLSAHLRYCDGRAAAVSLSDRASAWFRGATLLGAGGCIRFDDHSMEWTNATGEILDESRPAAGVIEGPAGLVASEVAGQLDGARPSAPAVRMQEAYALAEAALLSARTGQPESPATIRRMAGDG